MTQEAFTLPSPADKLVLHGFWVLPDAPPKAVIQLSHGMCEHKERYLPAMLALAQRGYACAIHDHRGHGESVRDPDDLGYFYEDGANALVEDLHAVTTEIIRKRFPELPVFLFGHSMGSLAVRVYTQRYDDEIQGLIVCGSPSRKAGAAVGRRLASLLAACKGDHSYSKLLDSLVLGSFGKAFPGEGENAWLCTVSSVVDAYNRDPLSGFSFTINGYQALFDLLIRAYSADAWQMHRPKLPVMFISGGNDPCRISHQKFLESVRCMETAGYENVTWRIYEGMRHEILNEARREEVYRDIADFYDACLPLRYRK